MPLVDETVELAAAPPGDQLELHLEGAEDRPHETERHVVDLPVLQPHHGGPPDARSCGHVGLSPTQPEPNRAHPPAQLAIVHGADHAVARLRAAYAVVRQRVAFAGALGPSGADPRPWLAISQPGARISSL